MVNVPELVAEFLGGKRIAVAGVSEKRDGANAVYRKLRDSGYEALPVNPKASEVEGVRCYPDLGSIPGTLDGVVVATHPEVSVELVRQSSERGVPRVWFIAPSPGASRRTRSESARPAGSSALLGVVRSCTARSWISAIGA
jgi:predicted CoA-binding protein